MEESVQSTTITLLRNFCRVRSPNLGVSALLFAPLISCCQKQSCWVNILTVSFAILPSFAKIRAKCQSAKLSLQLHEALNELLQIIPAEYWPNTQMCLETRLVTQDTATCTSLWPFHIQLRPRGRTAFLRWHKSQSYLCLEKLTWSAWSHSAHFPWNEKVKIANWHLKAENGRVLMSNQVKKVLYLTDIQTFS